MSFKLENTTWKCDACGKTRKNKFISVLNYPLRVFSGASRNFKYCNDNPECLNTAYQKADTGKI